MVFGASNIVGDIRDAVDNAFDTILRIKNHTSHEKQMVEKTALDRSFDDDEIAFLKETIMPAPYAQSRYNTASDDGNPRDDTKLSKWYMDDSEHLDDSIFGRVILVLGEPVDMLSKELLYTAITRQKDKLVILYNDGAYHLRDYASASCSEVARRFTCLFELPDIVEFKKKYYEQSLIHKTMKGELVRSKSEVTIANMLFQSGIDYEYEKELDLGEDGIRIPDFTIEDSESGTLFYWEHCGMPGDAGHNRHWQEKKVIYEKHGIIENKNLIVSEDSISGGIDSAAIKELIGRFLS